MSISMIAMPIIWAVLKVGVLALAGYLLARRGLLHETALVDLSSLVIKVTVPCLIFANASAGFVGISFSSSLIVVLGAPVVLGIGAAGGIALAKLLKIDPTHFRAVVCVSTFQNYTYLPIAVATSVLPPLAALFPVENITHAASIGGTSVVFISLCGILYSPLFWGLGLWWLTQEPGDVKWSGYALVSRLLPPPVIGVLLGYTVGLTPLHLALTPPHAPLHFLFLAIADVGNLTITLANLILGGMLAQAIGARALKWRDALAVVLGKLIFVPAVGFFLLWLSREWWLKDGTRALAVFILFLQMITPPATNLAVMTKGRSKGGQTVAGTVVPGLLLATYPLAILTMPLWLVLFFRMLSQQ